MEEQSQDIIFSSLRNAGVPIPSGVSTIRDLTPEQLFPICSHSLSIIDQTLSFPSPLPEDSVADRFKICSDLTTAFKRLGFVGDISFHKFLYPSEEDLHKLVRFLVGRLAVYNEAQKESDEKETGEKVSSLVKEVKLQAQAAVSVNVKLENALVGEFTQSDSNQSEFKSSNGGVSASGLYTRVSSENGLMTVETAEDSTEKVEVRMGVPGEEELVTTTIVCSHDYKQKEKPIQENSHVREFSTELAMKNSELQYLEEEYDLLKALVEMTLDNEHPNNFCIQQLKCIVESRRDALTKLESHWHDLKIPLEEKRRTLEDALCSRKPGTLDKLQKKMEMEQEIASVLAETKNREKELATLKADLKMQPNVASRQSFVQRIKEITKNSRKLDADIERILKDTRELQLESNSIQERLDRTYAVVNETMLREARKDPVGRQAYRILTGIHQAFEQMAETILVTDRTQREVADYEAKYATLASRSLNIDKLRADLDAIRRENDILEQQLGSQ